MRKFLNLEMPLIRGDKTLIAMIFLLMFASLGVIFSSTGKMAFIYQGGNTWYYLLRHALLMVLSVGAMILARYIHWKQWFKMSTILMVGALALSLVTAFMGDSVHGASRWFLGVQPSELIKVVTVIYVAQVLSVANNKEGCVLDSQAWVGLGLAFAVVMVIAKDNFSTAAILGSVCLTLMFVAQVKWKILLTMLGTLVAAVSLIVLVVSVYPPAAKIGRFGTIASRITTFIGVGDKKDKDDTYQSDQASIAIARGGIIGVGPGNSEQKNYLPFPFSDFIYAIIAEEYGLLGGSGVLLVYLIILYRVVTIAKRVLKVEGREGRSGPEIFPALVVFGLGFMMVLQALSHIAVNIGMLPVTGQTLPLMSMGGTSQLLVGFTLGIILDISYRYSDEGLVAEKQNSYSENAESADESGGRHTRSNRRTVHQEDDYTVQEDERPWKDEDEYQADEEPRTINRTGLSQQSDDDYRELEKQQRDILRKLK